MKAFIAQPPNPETPPGQSPSAGDISFPVSEAITLLVGAGLVAGWNLLKSLLGSRLYGLERSIQDNRARIEKLESDFTEFRTESRVSSAETKMRLDAIHNEILQLNRQIIWEPEED